MVSQINSDPRSVHSASARDPENLVTLIQQADQRLRAYLRRMTLQEDLAADLTQETLVAVLSALGHLRRWDRFWPWVFRIAHNKAKQHYRQESRRRVSTWPLSEDPEQLAEGHSPAALEEVAQQEQTSRTRAALAGMSDRHRRVLTLRFFQDLPHKEIARILDCSTLAARTALCRAKLELACELRRRSKCDGCGPRHDFDHDGEARFGRRCSA